MILAIWGRDGVGKSTLSDSLGVLFAQKGICITIDTDLTQPTIPARIAGNPGKGSLGRAISGSIITDIKPYLHQHPKHKGLFFAGLTDKDDYLSYEIGLEADDNAQDLIDRCTEQAGTIIIDLSGQRSDPFLPPALLNAENIVLLVVPDVQGLCWFLSVKSLLESMNAQGRVIPVAMKVQPYHDVGKIEKTGGLEFAASFPYLKEVAALRDTGETAVCIAKYAKPLKSLFKRIWGGGTHA